MKYGKVKWNILNIKYNNYNLITFIIISLIISSEELKNKIIKLNLNSEIVIYIKGNGTQKILNSNISIPNETFINNNSKTISTNNIYNLTLEENEIKLVFYESLIDCSYMFSELTNITKINFIKFNTLSTNMEGMFFGCSNLESLDLSYFNTYLF